jgi:exonuclease III
MIGIFWNIRGLNKSGRAKGLSEFISRNSLDFVTIQETKKESFLLSFLDSVNYNMIWNYVPANGTKGGILVGLKNQTMDILGWQHYEYSDVCLVKNLKDNGIWRLISVYGSPYDEHKLDFINELEMIMGPGRGPPL